MVELMNEKECLEQDLKIATNNKNHLKSQYEDEIKNVIRIREKIEKLEPSRNAKYIMEHVGNNCKLLRDEKTLFGDHQIDVLIPYWVHDEHGYRSLDTMKAIHRMGYTLGGVVSNAPHQIELRFFKVK